MADGFASGADPCCRLCLTTFTTEVAAAVSQLPERQRLVLFLRYYADLDYDAIAKALSISSGTAGATLTTARAALAQTLDLKEAMP